MHRLKKNDCLNYFEKAIVSCPTIRYEEFELEVADPICITDKFVEISKIKNDKFDDCQQYLIPEESKRRLELLEKNRGVTPD